MRNVKVTFKTPLDLKTLKAHQEHRKLLLKGFKLKSGIVQPLDGKKWYSFFYLSNHSGMELTVIE